MWEFSIKDLIDILAVAALMYYLYRKTKNSGTIVIFQGILAVIVVWVLVSQVLRLRLLGGLLDQVMSVSMIIIVVLFQNSIREALIRVGSQHRWSSLLRFFGQSAIVQSEESTKWVDEVVMACRHMSEQQVGALIIVQHTDNVMPLFLTPGCDLDAVVSSRLIEQIFYKNTPLHDGAMLIRNGRIVQAAANLPLTRNKRVPPELGTRHRAAIGISELCDCYVIVVSEETGGISVCSHGRIVRDMTPARLQKALLTNKNTRQ